MKTILFSLLAGFALTACAGRQSSPRPHPKPPPAKARTSTAKDRKAISITVYNQNLGLVREVREVDLGTGRIELAFRDVPGHVRPETVHIQSMGPLSVLEQNFRYDVITPQKLLESHVGQQVTLIRRHEELGTEERVPAKVLAAEKGTVLRVGSEITYNYPGRFAFPGLPKDLVTEPTLVWLLNSERRRQTIEVSYLTRNMGWKADYVLTLDEADKHADLKGWVTLTNRSKASFENAQLKLVAGDVNQVMPVTSTMEILDEEGEAPGASADDDFTEESFFEYHLYALSRPTHLLDNEQKQLSLVEADAIQIDKKLIYFGRQNWFRGRYGQVTKNQKVGVYLDIKNDKLSGLGVPLPRGTLRVYKRDASGSHQFVGEDRIDHTPRDEKVRVKLGEAFDVVGDRKQTGYRRLSSCMVETAWEVSLRNHKKTPETVTIVEPVGGQWRILSSSHAHTRQDAHTFTFEVDVPRESSKTVSYRLEVRWC